MIVEPFVKLLVVIPVAPAGPKYRFDHVVDTVESVRRYAVPDRRIVIVDDSGADRLGERLRNLFPDIGVYPTQRNYGHFGGLYLSLCKAIAYARQTCAFRLLLRMDTDALLIGSGLEEEALRFFDRYPNVGQIGTYRIESDGRPSDYSWPRETLARQTRLNALLRRPTAWRTWCTSRSLYAKARANGYDAGEHVLGGAYLMSGRCVDRLIQAGWFPEPSLEYSGLQEDHLFGLLVKAAGMDLGDFGTPADPVAVKWKGLPASPEELLAGGKKLVHSTRFWQDMDEDQVRAYFRHRREADAVAAGPTH